MVKFSYGKNLIQNGMEINGEKILILGDKLNLKSRETFTIFLGLMMIFKKSRKQLSKDSICKKSN